MPHISPKAWKLWRVDRKVKGAARKMWTEVQRARHWANISLPAGFGKRGKREGSDFGE